MGCQTLLGPCTGLRGVVADFSRQRHSMEGLVTTLVVPGPPAVLDSVALGWDLRICISSQVPGGAVAAHMGSTP